MGYKEANRIGMSGEHLVCSDLFKRGYSATLVGGNGPYDILLDTGVNIYKVQVKTTTHEGNSNTYLLRPSRNFSHGQRVNYNEGEWDIIAFVILNEGKIGYLRYDDIVGDMDFRTLNTVSHRESSRTRYIEDYGIEKII